MSHFLARLIDRVQGRAPLAEPLIPPSYATSAWAEGSLPAAIEGSALTEGPAAPIAFQPARMPELQAYEGSAQAKAPSVRIDTIVAAPIRPPGLRVEPKDAAVIDMTVPTQAPAAPVASQPARTSALGIEAETIRPLPSEPLAQATTPPSMDVPLAPAVSIDDESSPRGERTARQSISAIPQQDMQIELEARHLVPPVPRKSKAQSREDTNTGVMSSSPRERLVSRPVESEQSLTLQHDTTNTFEPASPIRATVRQDPREALQPELLVAKSDDPLSRDRPAPHLNQARSQPTLTRPQRTTEARLEPPTINVTIGRIEVRAVTPPTPPPKRNSPPAPKLSLDDYLKKQGKDRR